MVNDNLLEAARAKAATIPLDHTACLEQLRAVVAAQHHVRIEVISDLAGHGVWFQSPHTMIVFTGPTSAQQLHDLAHLVLGHEPRAVSPQDVVHGRATEGTINAFSTEQETEADVMSKALAERLMH